MTEEKQELELWQPEPFSGTDLLPELRPNAQLAEGEEVVGKENIDQEDIILPVLSVMTGTSDLVKREVDGAKAGLVGMTILDKVFELPLRTIVIHHHKSRAKFGKKGSAEDQQRCVSRDYVRGDHYGDCDECGRSEWDGDNKPICAKSNNFVCLTPYGPAVLRCNNTNYKAGKRFVTTFDSSGLNMWHHPVMLTARRKEGNIDGLDCVWFPIELTWMERETVPPDVREKCRQTYEGIAAAHDRGGLRGDTESD